MARDVDGEPVLLEKVVAVWFRRLYVRQNVRAADLTPAQLECLNQDCQAALLGQLMISIRGEWISDPIATFLAENKLIQLQAAVEAGFVIPKTLVSQVPADVRNFFQELGGSVIVKPVKGTIQTQLYTRALHPEDLGNEDAIRAAPAIYQELIPGTTHLRIVCFGDRCLSFAIRSESLDWRIDNSLDIRPHQADEALCGMARAALSKLNLKMGIIDCKLLRDEIPVWLEVNPQGQFLFCEGVSRVDLLSPFAEYLHSVCVNRSAAEGPTV